MPESLDAALADLRALILTAPRLVRAVAAGRRRGEHPTYRKAELRWVDLRAGRRLQVVTYDERQAFTRNVDPAEAAGVVDELLAQPYGNWHVDTTEASVQLRVTKKGAAQVHRSAAVGAKPARTHDRRKPRMLDPADPFLQALDISDIQGRVKPSRQPKYRQVEEFLRAIGPVLEPARQAAGDEPVRVVDLGCGNAYLSFAAFHWLAAEQVPVELTGVDVKAQARVRNTRLAAELGWSERVTFLEGTIDHVQLDHDPHVVLALHACDTATDDALARAVEWGAPVILAAPCCHHDLQRQLARSGVTPEPYGLLARHGILRERFADVLTDSIRAAILRIMSYRVEVIEFVESAHTPRNVLLRAVRTGAPAEPTVLAEYRRLTQEWGVVPALAERLGARFEAALRADDHQLRS